VLQLTDDAVQSLQKMPDGTTLHFAVTTTEEKAYTWNAVGVLRGGDPALQHSAVLLSAHLDHLGIGAPVNGDSIYNGADDDASGTTAVLELARTVGLVQGVTDSSGDAIICAIPVAAKIAANATAINSRR